MDQIFKSAVPILAKIEEAGFEAYFVGGSVRDYLLNRAISDIDIATSATPNEIKAIFPNTVDIGIEHGTVLVLYKGTGYEITTFRSESEYKDYRRPNEVYFIRSLIEDLKRRDFTMNAMAMNKNGEIIDPFNGQKAIAEKTIVTVGNAEERFSEDALRMMRALRFVSQLNFTLDPKCYKALTIMGSLLQHIAVERKTSEFEKLLMGPNRIEAIHLLNKTNLDQYLPSLKVSQMSIAELQQYPCSDLHISEMWGLLIYALRIEPQEVEKFLRNWKLPVKRIREIQAINQWIRYRLANGWDHLSLYAAGKEILLQAERVLNVINHQEPNESIDELIKRYDTLPIQSRSELEISGTDLMELLDRPSGAWIKEWIELIEKEILEGRLLNENKRIREWVLFCSQK